MNISWVRRERKTIISNWARTRTRYRFEFFSKYFKKSKWGTSKYYYQVFILEPWPSGFEFFTRIAPNESDSQNVFRGTLTFWLKNSGASRYNFIVRGPAVEFYIVIRIRESMHVRPGNIYIYRTGVFKSTNRVKFLIDRERTSACCPPYVETRNVINL